MVLILVVLIVAIPTVRALLRHQPPTAEQVWPQLDTQDPGWDHPVNCRCALYHN